jgi:hypothetical protein
VNHSAAQSFSLPFPPHPAREEPPRDLSHLAGPGLRAFFRIAEAWGLSVPEQMTLLGLQSRSTYFRWKREQGGRLDRDHLERISHVLGIYKALHILLPDREAADQWIRRPNDAPLFEGAPALQRMLAGGMLDLYVVRAYLDAQRGGWA